MFFNDSRRFFLFTSFFLFSSSFSVAEPSSVPSKAPVSSTVTIPSSTVIATLDGQAITNADLDILESFLPEFSRLPEEQRRAAVFSNLLEIRLLAREAQQKGFDKEPEFKNRVEILSQRTLYATFIEKEIAKKIEDKELRAFYDKEAAAAVPLDEIKARHILVKTKKEALSIIKDLDSGKKFDDLAKKKSIDPVSSPKGGDLGYFTRGNLVAEFENAAFELPVGQYTKKPVQTKFGFHIISVEDKRKQPLLTFEEAKSQALSALVRKKYLSKIEELRGSSKLEIIDENIKKGVASIEKASKDFEEKASKQPSQKK